jgi:hypothetical protein
MTKLPGVHDQGGFLSNKATLTGTLKLKSIPIYIICTAFMYVCMYVYRNVLTTII